jgi:hypothetical protein
VYILAIYREETLGGWGGGGGVGTSEKTAQSRQSAKLFTQSSELGLPIPTPSPAGWCVRSPPPPFGSGGGHTRLQVRGWGSPNSTRGQTLWYSIYKLLCERQKKQFAPLSIFFSLELLELKHARG